MSEGLRSILELNLRAAWARAFVRFRATFREAYWILFDAFLPILGVAAYVMVYRALNAPQVFSGFVILGGMMTPYWLNVLWSMASQFYWEKLSGNLELFLIAPASRMSILFGMAFGGIFMTTSRALGVLLLGLLLFRIPISIPNPFLLLYAFLITLVALYGLGMMFSSVYLLWGREAWHISNLLTEPVYLFSGFYFPVRAFGFWVALIASLIPATLGLDSLRQILFPHPFMGFLPLWLELLLLTFLAAFFFSLAYWSLLLMEKLGKQTGTMTLRGQ
ncbi:MAG: ABC transporter permease [bacterium JZ-2024 1]